MLGLLRKIYEEYGFIVKEEHDILFSEKAGQEYFFLAQYNEEELENFFECDKTSRILNKFNEFRNEENDIKKNTSLIICLRVSNIKNSYLKYKNVIFSIEEDEYFFRKYVILYSDIGIHNYNYEINIYNQIHKILLTENRIDEFQKKYFEDEEFFISIQIVVKIPFLVFQSETDEYKPLSEIINEKIILGNITDIDKSVQTLEDTLTDDNEDAFFKQLESAFLSEEIDQEILNNFVNNFDI